jgi:phosphoglycerate dehydrogenase-like enzyme
MVLMTDSLVVTFPQEEKGRPYITEALQGAADVVYLADLDDDRARAAALRGATVLLARNTAKELRPHEPALIERVKLIQFINAGVDFVPLKVFDPAILIASNGGAYAEPMAEHALAMVLAAAKRLLVEHEALKRGEFNQGKRNRSLAGGVCGVLGFGGIGVATARLMRALGMKIHAINRRGVSDEPTDWIGTPAGLDTMLKAADVLVISTPLTPATQGWIGARELGLMKPDAILVNLARGEIVDEAALFAHLQANPRFDACIDAWWIEPVRHGLFRMDFPFLSLPNVIGSPHNSASVPGTGETGLRRAVANIRRALAGETPLYLVGPADCMM